MKKIIIKHIIFIISFIFCSFLLNILFVYDFFSYQIKKELYSVFLDSKQVLTEIVTKKENNKERINNFLFDLKQNKNIFDFSIFDEKKQFCFFSGNKQKNYIDYLFSCSYSIKQNERILGYINIWPTSKIVSEIFAKKTNIVIVLSFSTLLLIIFIILLYWYITKYIFIPVAKIEEVTELILNQNQYSFDFSGNRSLWNNVFANLKLLNSKIVDIKTAMKLVVSASNILISDTELLNLIHLFFSILQQKINNNAICLLFTVGDNFELNLFAKDSSFNLKQQSISDNTNSMIFACYQEQKEYISDNINLLNEYDKQIFKNENVSKIITVPLNVGNKYCAGVFCVGIKDIKYFDKEIKDFIREMAKCFALFIFHRENYSKTKEQNRKFEMELKNISKELVNKNVMLIQKIRSLNAISDIVSYATTNINLENVVSYIVEKIKQLFSVETAGIFMYSSVNDEFYTVGGSFGINNVIKTKNKNNTVSNKVFKEKKSVIIKSKEELKQYPNSRCLEPYLNIKTLVSSPVLKDDKVIAVVMALNKVGSGFSEYDVKTLEALALEISLIIGKINLYNMYNVLKNKQ